MSLFSKFAVGFASVSMLTASAFAAGGDIGFGVEPYVGYQAYGTLGGDTSATRENVNGLGFGARAVVKYANFVFLGPDFTYNPSLAISGTAGAALSNMSNMRLGLVAGVQLPMSFRVWLGYNFMDNYNVTLSGSAGSLNSSSFKFGAGWGFLPYLSLNAEYIIGSYSKATFAGTAIALTPAQTSGLLFVSVSAPFSFSM